MRYILSRASGPVLDRFAGDAALFAFDFDGTLARIVADPAVATMRASTRTLLAALAERRPCVVISGRRRADVVRRLHGVRVAEVLGNHGIEPWLAGESIRREVRRWKPALEARLARVRGVQIEDKGFSITVHYRRAGGERSRARAAIYAAAAAIGPVRVVDAKQALNLLPRGVADKGTAFEEALARLGCRAAVYVGDDATDEDVFALGRSSRLMIRVGKRRDSLAPYYIRSQSEIDLLLHRFLRGRK